MRFRKSILPPSALGEKVPLRQGAPHRTRLLRNRICFFCGVTDEDNRDPKTLRHHPLQVQFIDLNWRNQSKDNILFACRIHRFVLNPPFPMRSPTRSFNPVADASPLIPGSRKETVTFKVSNFGQALLLSFYLNPVRLQTTYTLSLTRVDGVLIGIEILAISSGGIPTVRPRLQLPP